MREVIIVLYLCAQEHLWGVGRSSQTTASGLTSCKRPTAGHAAQHTDPLIFFNDIGWINFRHSNNLEQSINTIYATWICVKICPKTRCLWCPKNLGSQQSYHPLGPSWLLAVLLVPDKNMACFSHQNVYCNSMDSRLKYILVVSICRKGSLISPLL